MNTTEKKVPVRNLERVQEKKFKTYEEAAAAKNWATKLPVHKIKVFARYDGTFDTVWYKKIGESEVKEAAPAAEVVETKATHGLKSKERKKATKKVRQ